MKANANRLSTPFDLHITLRHILSISTKKSVLLKAVGCPHCRSLFDEIPECRRCKDAAIPIDSCPCSFEGTKVKKKVIQLAAQHALEIVNKKLQTERAENGERCATLKLKAVVEAREKMASEWDIVYIVRFTVTPTKARFEAFMRRKFSAFSLKPKFEMIQEIVHMNKIREPKCVPESGTAIAKRFDIDYDENEDYEDD